MAIYRCEVKSHSRRAGKNKVSAVAAIAYRAGLRLSDNRGEIHNYTKRKGVEHSQIIAPPDAPEWAYDRQLLWAATDKAENRADAKFGREFIVALPHELGAAARTELAVNFTRLLVERFGFVADVAIHKPKTGDNHHAHIFCSTRVLTAEGFTSKTRDLDVKRYSTKLISQIRADWEDMTNAALANAGLDIRVDRRSHAELGDGLLPEVSLTRHDAELERQGIPTINGDHNRKIRGQNAKVIEQRAEEARQAQLKAEEDRLAREAQEATRIAILEREAVEAHERQVEAARIAKIDVLLQKYTGLEDRYITAWESLDSKLDALHTAKSKIDHDEAEDRAGRSTSTYVRYYTTERSKLEEAHQPKLDAVMVEVAKAAKEWGVCRAELEQYGHSFEPPPPSLWNKLRGKKSPEEISEDNYAHAVEKIAEFEPAGKRHEAREQQERNRQFVERQRIADEPERRAREAAEAELRHQENLRIRAERATARDAERVTPSSNPAAQPKPDDDSPSLG
jgi:hypothetical protein